MTQVLTKPIPLTNPLNTILQGCREGGLQYQEQLYKHCYPVMIKTCYRYAGDLDGAGIIFNNAMLRVFKGISQYKEEGKLMGWIKTIVINCCIDFVKSKEKFKEEAGNIAEDDETSIPPDALDRVTAKEIQACIRNLPRATATVFNLFVYEGLTHKQIASALGISEGTSKWHINEGRRLLKQKLKNY